MNEYPYQEQLMGGTDGDSDSRVVGGWTGNKEICLRCGLDRIALRNMLVGSKGDRDTAHGAIETCPACKKAFGGK